MEPKNLESLIKQPESETLEFKTRLPDSKNLGVLFSSLANTDGGQVVIGVQEGGKVVGVDKPDRANLVIQKGLQTISPSLQVNTEIIPIQGKSVLVITIPKGSQSPYAVAGQVFQRTGAQLTPVTAQAIYSAITSRATSQEDLRSEIERLSRVIENLTREVTTARSLRAKIPGWLVSGFIGALTSFFFSLAF